MMFKILMAGVALLVSVAPAMAEITIRDAYARAASPKAKAGAAFMVIENSGAAADRLVSATSTVAHRVELHTHKETGDGLMQMLEVEEGFVIPAGGAHALQRGGDHVMFMGLKQSLLQGDTVEVILTFEKAGEIALEIPVDLARKPAMGHGQTTGG